LYARRTPAAASPDRQQVLAALDRAELSPRARTAVRLHFEEGLSYEEVAAELGIMSALAQRLVMESVSDPHNLGALLRTGECAGVTGAVLPRHRGAQVTPTVTKVAAGAVEHVPMAVVASVPGALTELGKAGVWTVGLDPEAEVSVFDLPVGDQPVALVVGSEGKGLSRLARQRCELLVAIPRLGALASLNVSAAGAVACYEVARRRVRG
jgi:23S rRNA (guanosine2251-2'-O)-methyltransferase